MPRQHPAWALADDDLRGSTPARGHDGPLGPRRRNERRGFLVYVQQVLVPTLRQGAGLCCRPTHPIENAFAKFKAVLCRTAARTFDDLISATRDALHAFTPGEFAN
jgi:hypothetical protein